MGSLLGKAVRAVRPRNLADAPDYAGRPGSFSFASPAGSDRERELAMYSEVGTLFSVVNRLSTATGKVEWKLWRRSASGLDEDRPEVLSHPALSVWSRPNNFYTRSRLVRTGQQHQDLTGETWFVVVRDRRMPSLGPLEIWPVRPDRMTPVPSRDSFIAGYVYTSPGGEKIPLNTDDVLTIMLPNPLDPYRGMGPVQSIMVELDSARYTAEWNRNFFRNSAQPDGVIEVPTDLGDDEFNQMVRRWGEQHRGVNNAHRVAVLENGAKFVPNTMTQKDMQFVQLREVSRDTIREAYGIPKFALGDVDDVNRASAEASDAFFQKELTVPRLDALREMLNFQFLPMFYPGGWRTVDVEFDYVSPVPPDLDREAAERSANVSAATALIDRGTDPTATLEAFNLPALPMAPTQAEPPQSGAPAGPTAADEAAAQADVAAKIIPAIGIVVELDEARSLLARAGWPIDPFRVIEPSEAPEPTADPTGVPDDGEAQDAATVDSAPGGTAPVDARRRSPHGRIVNSLGSALVPVGGAWRPLNTREEDAGLNPEGVQADWSGLLDRLLRGWAEVTSAQRDALADHVRMIINSGDVNALATLTASSSDAAALLLEYLTDMSGAAADRVVGEARDQGVSIEPAQPDHAALTVVASVTASLLTGALANSAAREALRWLGYGRDGDTVAQATADHLAGLSDAFARANLGHALTRAQNMARAATFEQARGVVKVKFYASEVLDGNTCKPCAKIDGKELPSTDAMILAYGGGPYLGCLGTIRCRGMAIGVFES